MTSGNPTVLVTGGAGRMGTYLRTGLPALGWRLRLLDVTEAEAGDGIETVQGDVTDPSTLDAAFEGVDAVVHLAGIMRADAPFDLIDRVNIAGTNNVLEAARKAGVKRFVYASSNHANGLTPRSERGLLVERDRPDSYYGASKLYGEALCRLYHDRFDFEVACLRIGSCFDLPRNPRMLGTWLSPDDSVRLIHAALSYDDLGYVIAYGTSANTRNWWDLSPALKMGYEPRDNAESFAGDILKPFGGVDPNGPETPQGGDTKSLP